MSILDLLGLTGGGAASNGASPTGTTPNANPTGGFLSRLGLDDPDKRSRLGQSLIALGGSMMKAGGPSYTPNNFLGALGDGMQSFAKVYAGGDDDALKRQYLRAQIGNMGANTQLHQIQAAAAQAQAQARAAYNGTPNPAGTGDGAIVAPTAGVPGVPAGPGVPGAPAGVPAGPGQPPAPQQAPGQPLDIRPPAARPPAGAGSPQATPPTPPAPHQGNPPVAAPNSPLIARIAELNAKARQARAAGYEEEARQYSAQALEYEKHAAGKGMYMNPDGTFSNVPGYAAGISATAQAEAAGKAGGQLPTDLLKMEKESELRREEQALKDQNGDKAKFDEQAQSMNATWNANEYNKKFLAATNIRAGFERAYSDKSGLATAQLVLDWYKLNDPGSVVSQNEMQTLSTKTQSLGEGMVSAVNQALGGGGMSDENKAKLLKNMDGKYQDQRKTYEKQRDNQRSLAGKIGGIDPTMVIPDLAELHSPWKSPQELEAERVAQEAAARNPVLGGGGRRAPATPPGLGGGGGTPRLPTLAPNDPKLRTMKKGDQFMGTDGQVYTIN
ncbi:hypothetical protein [Methylorubrum thiocyanatum]|uniref:hypothetical protein n=1 Tax=Methylorubrum thiocyanatum TaxID=47958 RepID=UPI003F81150B